MAHIQLKSLLDVIFASDSLRYSLFFNTQSKCRHIYCYECHFKNEPFSTYFKHELIDLLDSVQMRL